MTEQELLDLIKKNEEDFEALAKKCEKDVEKSFEETEIRLKSMYQKGGQ
jgi:hypothetical protein